MTAAADLVGCPVDLHLHSTASDGELDPEQLAAACAGNGVRVAAVVDHDTVAGAAAFRAAAGALGVRVVDGCEISTRWRGADCHLLAYGVDPADPRFAARVGRAHHQARARFAAWSARFEAFGTPVDPGPVTALLERTRTPYFGRFLDAVMPSLTRYAALAPYADRSRAELVRDWFAEGKPFFVPEPAVPPIEEALDWVAAAGGVAVLAHPGRLVPPDRLAAAVRPLVERGLAGIEIWTTWHDPGTAAALAAVAARLDLLGTAGSDFHGPVKPWAPAPGRLPGGPADPDRTVARLLTLANRDRRTVHGADG